MQGGQQVPQSTEAIKLSWDRADLSHYQAICSDRLSQISVPVSALCAHVMAVMSISLTLRITIVK